MGDRMRGRLLLILALAALPLGTRMVTAPARGSHPQDVVAADQGGLPLPDLPDDDSSAASSRDMPASPDAPRSRPVPPGESPGELDMGEGPVMTAAAPVVPRRGAAPPRLDGRVAAFATVEPPPHS